MKEKTWSGGFDLAPIGLLIFGGVLLAVPDISIQYLCYLAGGLIGAYGIFRVLRYLLGDRYLSMVRKDLAMGVISLIIGALVALNPGLVQQYMVLFFALALLVGAANKLQTAVDLRRMQSGFWSVAFLGMLLSLAAGLVLLFYPLPNPRILTLVMGIGLVQDAVLSLISVGAVALAKRKVYGNREERTAKESTANALPPAAERQPLPEQAPLRPEPRLEDLPPAREPALTLDPPAREPEAVVPAAPGPVPPAETAPTTSVQTVSTETTVHTEEKKPFWKFWK